MGQNANWAIRILSQVIARFIYFAGATAICFATIVTMAPPIRFRGGAGDLWSLTGLFSLGVGLLFALIGPQLYRYYAHRGRGTLDKVREASRPPEWDED